jgi:prefoldin subunit 5
MYMNGKQVQLVTEFLGVNKEIVGLRQQIEQHEMSIKSISNIIKKLAKNRNKKLQRIIHGTNIVDEIEAKEAIGDLQKKKEELEIGLKGLQEQLVHQEDHMSMAAVKVQKIVEKFLPKEIGE